MKSNKLGADSCIACKYFESADEWNTESSDTINHKISFY